MAARQPLLNFLPLVFSLLSFILILLILLAGTNNALSTFYYLKTDTTSLSIPSKLSSSTFLSDLSTVSGADYTGPPATSTSLGLAQTYTLHLLTSCAHFSTGTVCDHPRLGFTFDPASNLKLDSTALQGTFPPALLSSLSVYHRTSPFLADAYVLSATLAALAPAAAVLGAHSRAAGIAAATLASLASIFLFGAGVAAVVVFRGLDAQINAAFSSSGLRSETGAAPGALGFVAFVLAVVTAVVFSVRARSSPVGPRGVVARSIGTMDGKGAVVGAEGGVAVEREGLKPGLWRRIPTWRSHRYVQVEKQPALLKTRSVAGSMEAVVVTSPAGTKMRARGDDDWAGNDEYISERDGDGGSGQRGIPMLSLGEKRRERSVDTAYEPYSGDGRGGV